MALIQSRSHFCKERFFIVFIYSFPPFKLDEKLFNQFASFLRPNHSIIVFLVIELAIPKYIDKDL